MRPLSDQNSGCMKNLIFAGIPVLVNEHFLSDLQSCSTNSIVEIVHISLSYRLTKWIYNRQVQVERNKSYRTICILVQDLKYIDE